MQVKVLKCWIKDFLLFLLPSHLPPPSLFYLFSFNSQVTIKRESKKKVNGRKRKNKRKCEARFSLRRIFILVRANNKMRENKQKQWIILEKKLEEKRKKNIEPVSKLIFASIYVLIRTGENIIRENELKHWIII